MRTLATVLLVLLALTGVAACSSGDSSNPTIEPAAATVIDVRTPAEYADGHLRGAVNIDVQDQGGFLNGVRDLDRDGAYIVYCRSGNRSAAATRQMQDLGFTDVTDAGGLQEAAAATGLPIVTT
jgi:phage shock protein E